MKTNASDHLPYLLGNLDLVERESTPLYHPLGFVSCLVPCARDMILRLHFWPEGERRYKNPLWPIHTHNYRLSSFVVAGEVIDVQYDAEISEFGAEVIYEVEYSGEDSKISESARKCFLTEARRNILKSGDSYQVERGIFHQSEVEQGRSAVTFVCLTDKGAENPLVVGEPTGRVFPYERVRYDKDLFWRHVRSGLSAL